ncbi:MAG TPA: acyltransferase family protein, partial [Flavipsychrobacter sp.]
PPAEPEYNVTMTHIRIDSLLAGVLISYFFYFRFEYLNRFVSKYRYLLIIIAIVFLSWTPFIEPETNFFGKTTGYTLAYIAFGIILMLFLLSDNINHQLNRVLSKPVVSLVGKIGFSSYSIYVIHTLVINYVNDYARKLNMNDQFALKFFIGSTISVIAGLIITYTIEKYFLAVRDRHFPRRGYVGKKQIW